MSVLWTAARGDGCQWGITVDWVIDVLATATVVALVLLLVLPITALAIRISRWIIRK